MNIFYPDKAKHYEYPAIMFYTITKRTNTNLLINTNIIIIYIKFYYDTCIIIEGELLSNNITKL